MWLIIETWVDPNNRLSYAHVRVQKNYEDPYRYGAKLSKRTVKETAIYITFELSSRLKLPSFNIIVFRIFRILNGFFFRD